MADSRIPHTKWEINHEAINDLNECANTAYALVEIAVNCDLSKVSCDNLYHYLYELDVLLTAIKATCKEIEQSNYAADRC